MAILRKLFFIFILISLLNSCGMYIGNLFNNTDSVENRASAITDFSENFGMQYKILLLSDVHFDSHYEKNEKLFNFIDGMTEKPVACFILGDITRNCSPVEFYNYNRFCNDLRNAGIGKIYAIPGNHDCDDGGKLFLNLVFPHKTYYRVKTSKCSFYFLDSSEGSHGDAQLNNLREVISSDVNSKIVFSHYPLYVPESFNDKLNKTTERSLLISTFAKNRIKYYFCGHTHEYYTFNFGKFNEVVLGDFKWSEEWAVLNVDELSNIISYEYIQ